MCHIIQCNVHVNFETYSRRKCGVIGDSVLRKAYFPKTSLFQQLAKSFYVLILKQYEGKIILSTLTVQNTKKHNLSNCHFGNFNNP